MPNPTTDPVGYIMQAVLNPHDLTLPANRDAMRVVQDEIDRIEEKRAKLLKHRDILKERLAAPAA